jgi:alcohol dehydrogenase (cytochrome c)
MNRTRRALLTVSLLAAPVLLVAQGQSPAQGGLDPASILKPLADSWPTYSGDYTGRRFSALTQINQSTVKNLTLAWVARVAGGLPGAGGGRGGFGGRGGGGAPARVVVGGRGPEELAFSGTPNVKGSILQVGGVLYVTAPDNVWAIDAHDGHELWRYFWKTRGGTHIGNRGAGMWKNYLYFETPDNYLVSLDARTGQERWAVEIAKFEEEYFSTVAPIIVGDHVLVGTGNDIDAPGFLQSFDPETGKLQWKLYTVPMKLGDPGLDTWPSLDAARHGGAQTWIPGSYDPETKLYILGTIPGRWPGTTRRRRTTRTTGTRRRRRCSSMASSTAGRASWSPPRRATATSSRSIG